jgi:hypothetical protein
MNSSCFRSQHIREREKMVCVQVSKTFKLVTWYVCATGFQIGDILVHTYLEK